MRPTTISTRVHARKAILPVGMKSFLYKTVAIYPNFVDVGNAFDLLRNEDFTEDQISLLGSEQDDWQVRLGTQWETLRTAKGALAGRAVGAIPELVLVTGLAVTGGIRLLASGPLIAALGVRDKGPFEGSVLGGATINLESARKEVNIELEVEDAIGRGQWVIVAQTHDEHEAMRAQALLPDSRIVLEIVSNVKPH